MGGGAETRYANAIYQAPRRHVTQQENLLRGVRLQVVMVLGGHTFSDDGLLPSERDTQATDSKVRCYIIRPLPACGAAAGVIHPILQEIFESSLRLAG
jgi:hypothetical protein